MRRLFVRVIAALVATSCTKDFDRFEFIEGSGNAGDGGPGANTGDAMAGGAAGAASGGTGGGSGGLVAGGSGGMTGGAGGSTPDSGSGGNVDSGTGGTAGAGGAVEAGSGGSGGAAGTGGAAGCGPTDTIENCGACGRACDPVNVASLECSGDQCNSSCNLGWANCATPATGADDGCETNVDANDGNCGGCGNNCTLQGDSGGFSCTSSTCGCTNANQCGNSGIVDCQSGLCHCGISTCRPGERCGAASSCRCNNGAGCGASDTCCQTPSGCRDLATAEDSCGACGHACPAGLVCMGGTCQ